MQNIAVFYYISDAIRFKGKVVHKAVDDNSEHCVDIEVVRISQRDENIIIGKSTVILPSREAGTWPVEKRLSRN